MFKFTFASAALAFMTPRKLDTANCASQGTEAECEAGQWFVDTLACKISADTGNCEELSDCCLSEGEIADSNCETQDAASRCEQDEAFSPKRKCVDVCKPVECCMSEGELEASPTCEQQGWTNEDCGAGLTLLGTFNCANLENACTMEECCRSPAQLAELNCEQQGNESECGGDVFEGTNSCASLCTTAECCVASRRLMQENVPVSESESENETTEPES